MAELRARPLPVTAVGVKRDSLSARWRQNVGGMAPQIYESFFAAAHRPDERARGDVTQPAIFVRFLIDDKLCDNGSTCPLCRAH